MSLAYRLAAATGSVRRAMRGARRIPGRFNHAWDLWLRFGYTWDHAWRISRTWN